MIEALSKNFVVKELENIETFVGCKIFNNTTKDTIYDKIPQKAVRILVTNDRFLSI
jgi:hypothetical protein